ncbi:GNAT family N-acetyltransferase [Streptomyces peucetius]|uniref:GNAT family N-acetyltransferase n=1 Tax=Streptomyces peucetius TaxID=1950 RepID=A0ABY6IC54_STRPE|nr:GNAT family protein [Streptomyces peucetius]UYQ64571.1 GNAT family N-acetyltransferase [Streptomyces peucetius]
MFATDLGDDGAELRPLEPWQAEEFFDHMERGREYIGRYVGLPDIVTDVDAARGFLQRYADKKAADTGRIHGIWLADTLVGGVMLRTMDVDQGTCEAGCWLEPSAVGRGLVTRAVTVLVDWAIGTRGMHRVEWIVASANEASINVAKRLGMTHAGTRREPYLYRGERHDEQIWSVLAPEWQARRPQRG